MKKGSKKIIREASDGAPVPLLYDVTYQSKKNLKGETVNTTYFNLNNLTQTDRKTLSSPSYKAISRKDGSGVFYTMSSPEAFLGSVFFKNMYKYLASTGNYIMPDIEFMKAEISQAKLDKVTGDQIRVQNDKFENMFEKIMKSLNDPKTKELLRKISSIGFDINEKIYGIVRSPGNAIKTYAVKPDATFVATRKNFKKLYNRILKPTATPIILSVKNSGYKDQSKAEALLGVKFNDIKDNPHKKNAFDIASSTEEDGFSLAAYFDISDTMLIPGYPDTFNGKAGLVDNLRGVLNQLAKDEVASIKIDRAELGIVDNETNNEIFCKRVLHNLSQNNILPQDEIYKLKKLDPAKGETVVAIAKTYFSEISFAREHDPNLKEAKVYAAIAAVLTVEDIAETERLRVISKHERNVVDTLTTRKDFASISLPITNLIKMLKPISESSLNSNITVSPEYIMSIFNIDPESLDDSDIESDEVINEKTKIKENFFSILNKLNK